MNGWCDSYRACMKTPEPECELVATWVKSSVWKWAFTKALAGAPYCSSRFWKPSPRSFVQDVPGKTCMQTTWSSSLNSWRNYKRSWSSGRPTWKERDFGSTWAKPRSWYLCSGIPGRLKSDASFRCKRCTGQARPIDGKLMTEVTEGWEKLKMVPSFCYLGDCLSSGGGCELAAITRCRVAWGKFNELLPVLTSRSFPITSRGRVYNSCVSSAMLYAKPGPQPYPTYIACNVKTEPWFAGCAESPPRTKSARSISWTGCSLMIWQRYSAPADSDGTPM